MANKIEIVDPAHQSRDLAMVRVAIRKGWDIPAEILDKLPQLAWDIANDNMRTVRDRLSAMKLLVAVKTQNDKSDPFPRVVQHVHTMGPVTEANFADRKRLLLERANRGGDDTGGT